VVTRWYSVLNAIYADGKLLCTTPITDPSAEITLNRTDADFPLLFLSANAVAFNNLTADPWYNGIDPVPLWLSSWGS
jgi:hypothetical protein